MKSAQKHPFRFLLKPLIKAADVNVRSDAQFAQSRQTALCQSRPKTSYCQRWHLSAGHEGCPAKDFKSIQ